MYWTGGQAAHGMGAGSSDQPVDDRAVHRRGRRRSPDRGDLVVDASVEMARHLGVDETLIGLTVLAIGTSLPELATTVVAAVQKRTEVALGTMVGSNIFNVLGILGVGALASSGRYRFPRSSSRLDFPVMLGSAILLTVFVWLRDRSAGRRASCLSWRTWRTS